MCETNMVAKALAEDTEPHYTTISDFVSGMGEEIGKVFSEVLLVCSEMELIGGKLSAIDGCKLPSNASKEWSGTIGELKKKKAKLEKHAARLVGRHRELDKSEEAKKIQGSYRATMGKDKDRRKRNIERYRKNAGKSGQVSEDS